MWSPFPNDYVYDTHYNPKLPRVLVEPKPVEYDDRATGFNYHIPSYPPYVYWYPNPMECSDVCGERVCNAYDRRMNDYRMCEYCQSMKVPQCWDKRAQQCVSCPQGQALRRCVDTYGCANPHNGGWMQDRVAPINPKYTGCKQCK